MQNGIQSAFAMTVVRVYIINHGYQNYLNPFNPVTNIKFQLVKPGRVTLKVYDILGKEIATILNKELDAGFYKYQWNASGLAVEFTSIG